MTIKTADDAIKLMEQIKEFIKSQEKENQKLRAELVKIQPKYKETQKVYIIRDTIAGRLLYEAVIFSSLIETRYNIAFTLYETNRNVTANYREEDIFFTKEEAEASLKGGEIVMKNKREI